jgi:hypothetical protein
MIKMEDEDGDAVVNSAPFVGMIRTGSMGVISAAP